MALAGQIAAASARLTELIGDYDAAEGWREWGMRSTAHWLSWHCGMSLHAAREQVRVARALRRLPLTAAEFTAGRLSYSKVRALTRFASPESEAVLVETARRATGAQIEKLARAARRVTTADQVRDQYAESHVSWSVAEDGSVVGSFRLPPAEGAEFVQALRAGAGSLPVAPDDEERPVRRVARRGYAAVLVAMARRLMDDVVAAGSAAEAERYQLVVHVSGDEAELADGTPLHPETARRLACDCPASTMVDGPDGAALHLGRRSRRIRSRLRRAVEARDRGRCRAPGCTERTTQIHHVRHWFHGGGTCLTNLVSLCDGHHWLVHEGGFTILTRGPSRWALLGPTGVTTEPEPPPAAAAVPPTDPTVAADAVTGTWDGTRLTASVLDVLLSHVRDARERPEASPR